MLELVDELVKASRLERRPDELDGRAKMICRTRDGRRVVAQALRAVRDFERTYADEVGAARFEEAYLTSWNCSGTDRRPCRGPRRHRVGRWPAPNTPDSRAWGCVEAQGCAQASMPAELAPLSVR